MVGGSTLEHYTKLTLVVVAVSLLITLGLIMFWHVKSAPGAARVNITLGLLLLCSSVSLNYTRLNHQVSAVSLLVLTAAD